MKITRKGFASIEEDNSENYIEFIVSSIKHSDPEAEVLFDKLANELRVLIEPSTHKFRQEIIDKVLGAHKMLHLTPIFSKSLKISRLISYTIVF